MARLPHRIIKETQHLLAKPVPDIKAEPDKSNTVIFMWSLLALKIPPLRVGLLNLNYSFQKDTMTKIYHPNVDKLGRICLDILKEKWSPAQQICTFLLSIQALSAPNPDGPLANDVVEQWKTKEAQAIETARAWARLYDMNNI